MSSLPRVYLAGPEVFLPDAVEIGREKCRLAAEAGLEGVFPLDAALDLAGLEKLEQARRIGLANEALIRSCDALIANLTPFRGVSMDAGTAFEVGFMRALGKPVAGYSSSLETYTERSLRFRQVCGTWRDADAAEVEIEDFGLGENLMIEIAIIESGTEVKRHPAARDDVMRDFSSFKECLITLKKLLVIACDD